MTFTKILTQYSLYFKKTRVVVLEAAYFWQHTVPEKFEGLESRLNQSVTKTKLFEPLFKTEEFENAGLAFECGWKTF